MSQMNYHINTHVNFPHEKIEGPRRPFIFKSFLFVMAPREFGNVIFQQNTDEIAIQSATYPIATIIESLPSFPELRRFSFCCGTTNELIRSLCVVLPSCSTLSYL